MRNETSRDPVYKLAHPGGAAHPYVCTECGSLVPPDAVSIHTRWHWLLWREA